MPRLLFTWPEDVGHPSHRLVDGTLAFVDISGFTQLTERLARRGKAGAEEMSDILDGTFGELLTVGAEFDAHLVKWGGDALLLLFQGPQSAAAATAACTAMMQTLEVVGRLDTSAGEVTLRMSAGVHTGSFDFVLVGDRHRELLVTGPAATTTALMEQLADAGEIVMSAATATRLPAESRGEPRGSGILLAQPPPAHRRPGQAAHDPAGRDVSVFLPEPIRAFLLAHGGDGEHREVAVAFAEFTGVDELLAREGPAAVTEAVHGLVTATQEAAARHRVTFFETDIGPDGGKIMLVAGAPRSLGDNQQRLLHVARSVVSHAGPLRVRVGVNTGRVYAGGFGPPFRRTYSVKGDAVNLAARVMGKTATGEVWATDAVIRRCSGAFVTRQVEPFSVKGKSAPVRAHRVGAPAAPADRTPVELPPLVGREQDLALLLDGVRSAVAGSGAVIVVVGEPGIGKSRLTAELAARAGIAHIGIACEEYEATTPYGPLRRLLRSLLGIGQDSDRRTAADILTRRVSRDAPHLLPVLSLVAAVVDADVPDSEETEALTEQFRRRRLEEAAVDLLLGLLPEPSLLVVDDAHLADDSSAALLAALCLQAPARPLLVVVTRRDQRGGLEVPDDSYPVELRLEPLDDTAATNLAEDATDDQPLPVHVMTELVRRAGGNPLFVRALVMAARHADGVALPDNVEGVIGAQIDRLPPADRSLLRAAAALGMRFDPALLAEVLERESQAPGFGAWRRLASFVRPDGDVMVFRHALVRDTAYEGLPFRRRLALHALIGEAIERRAGGVSEEHAELLALHYAKAERWQATWFYARIAGDRAVSRYAFVEAAEFYEAALAAGRRESVEPVLLASVLERLGDVASSLGEFARSVACYQQAWLLVPDDPLLRARLAARLAAGCEYCGDLTEAQAWLTRGQDGLRGSADPVAAQEDARLVVRRAFLLHQQGDDPAAEACATEGLTLAEQSGARDAMAMAWTVLDIVEQMQGRFGVAPEDVPARRALALWQELGDLSWQARLHNYLGARAYYEGRWDEAVEMYEQSHHAYQRIGDNFNAAMELGNIAEIVGDRGEPAKAGQMLRQVLRAAKASRASFEVLFWECLRARFLARAGEAGNALAELLRVAHELETQGRSVFTLEARARAAECLATLGRADEALAMADGLLHRSADLPGSATSRPLLHRVRGYALAQLGRYEEAAAALATSLATARELNALHEVAFTLHALVGLGRLRADLAQDDADSELAALRARLAMTSMPDVPLRPEVSMPRQATAAAETREDPTPQWT